MARKVKGRDTYIPIYCETRRQKDMEAFGMRGGRPLVTPNTGRTYAVEVDGRWLCLTCDKPVSVILG